MRSNCMLFPTPRVDANGRIHTPVEDQMQGKAYNKTQLVPALIASHPWSKSIPRGELEPVFLAYIWLRMDGELTQRKITPVFHPYCPFIKIPLKNTSNLYALLTNVWYIKSEMPKYKWSHRGPSILKSGLITNVNINALTQKKSPVIVIKLGATHSGV